MAVPRPVLFALLGLGLVASLFLVTRSGTSESVRGPSHPVVQPQPAPAHPRSAHGKGNTHKTVAPHARKAGHPAPAIDPPDKPDKPVAKHAPARKPVAAPVTVEGRVLAAAQALGSGDVVVFFFTGGTSADDLGSAAAIASLRGVPRVHVFAASLDEVAAFRPMLSTVGITEVPSTVIVRPGRKAVLIQGFVDAGTLRQNVADALR